jgi:hypothetical protein
VHWYCAAQPCGNYWHDLACIPYPHGGPTRGPGPGLDLDGLTVDHSTQKLVTTYRQTAPITVTYTSEGRPLGPPADPLPREGKPLTAT